MSVFQRLREKNKLISFIIKLQNSAFFPALFALICIISGTGNKQIYLPCMWFLTLTVVFGGLFSKDLKIFIVPIFMGYYTVGIDVPEGYFSSFSKEPSFDYSSIWHFVACCALMLAVLIYRLAADGHFKNSFKRKGLFFWGILLIDGALLVSGIFSPQWTLSSFLFALMLAAILSLSYPLFLAIFDSSEDGIAYACKTLVFMGYAVIGQISIIAYRLHSDGILTSRWGDVIFLHRSSLTLSWGVATIIGGAIVLAISAAMYLVRDRKYPVLSFLSALIFWVYTIFIDTRSAIIFGLIAIFIGMLLCCFGGRNKRINRVVSLCTLWGAVIALVVIIIRNPDNYAELFHRFFEFLRLDLDMDTPEELHGFFSSRLRIWADGISDFLKAPIFGSGFAYGYFTPETADPNLFMSMYHNVVVQLLASTGIVGLFAALVHLKHVIEVIFRRLSVEKMLILLTPFCIIGMSLVDNFIFYPNFMLVYVAFLAAAEIILERRRAARINNLKPAPVGRKPRVVFTYVEAGKGHIVPTQTIHEEFLKHYGDKCEVIESRFFTETGDPDLEKTEILFRTAVQNQARSPIWSFLCKLGNLIAGDTFMLVVLLRMTISGRKTNKPAVKHIQDLDADVIYSAHWSIPFYLNQVKAPRPYLISFCPDVYSNGAFNVDCNNFLISSDVGYDQVNRARMYAGGNITQIPFPIRPGAENYKGAEKKALYREKLGIPQDEFVVVLCDGGYGMAKLEKTVNALLKGSEKMTVIALCGMNHELYLRLHEREKTCPEHIRLIAVDFTDKVLEYIATADVFAGKSGANAIAEPASLGVPIIVTRCITYIEKGIKNYYVRKIKGALYIPSARVAARRIRKFAADPSLLEPLRKNLRENHRQVYDAKASADLIWQRVCEFCQRDSEN